MRTLDKIIANIPSFSYITRMDSNKKQLIRFDWAIKKLLRHKANFAILEGFLSELLQEKMTIKQILDSESNKETADDKHNRVDLLVEDSKGELIIIEVQNSKEVDYFHRILYGTSKVITEHIQKGEGYSKVKKVISITIAYFDLGQGEDYVYHGTNVFKGLRKKDILSLSKRQQKIYDKAWTHEIFPEYWIIKVGQFNNQIQSKLDEWIFFLKNGEIPETFTAQGLPEAKERLDTLSLSKEEYKHYKQFLKRLQDIASEEYNRSIEIYFEREEGREEGRQEGIKEGLQSEKAATAFRLKALGFSIEEMIPITNLSIEELKQLFDTSS